MRRPACRSSSGSDAAQTAAALSLCVSFAAGTSTGWDAPAGRNKPLQPGWGAHGGTIAALLAANGQGCALDAIDGPRGFYAAHAWRQGWSRERVPRRARQSSGSASRPRSRSTRPGGMIQAADDCTLELVSRARDRPVGGGVRRGDGARRSSRACSTRCSTQAIGQRSGYATFVSWPCNVARAILSRSVEFAHLSDAAVSDPALLELAGACRAAPAGTKRQRLSFARRGGPSSARGGATRGIRRR